MAEAQGDTLARHDAYWRSRDRHRAEARSRERAEAAMGLLSRAGSPGGRLLDVGCGPGWALEAFARAGYAAVGLEASPLAAAEARGRGLDVRCLDVETSLPLDPEPSLGGPFDVVVALEFLEHVRDPLTVLRGILGLLRPGGRIVVSLPNEIHLAARLRILLGRLPFGGHEDPHLRHFDRALARRCLDAAGLHPLGAKGISLVPPRYPLLRRLAAPLVTMLPGLFTLATVHLLEVSPHGTT